MQQTLIESLFYLEYNSRAADVSVRSAASVYAQPVTCSFSSKSSVWLFLTVPLLASIFQTDFLKMGFDFMNIFNNTLYFKNSFREFQVLHSMLLQQYLASYILVQSPLGLCEHQSCDLMQPNSKYRDGCHVYLFFCFCCQKSKKVQNMII